MDAAVENDGEGLSESVESVWDRFMPWTVLTSALGEQTSGG